MENKTYLQYLLSFSLFTKKIPKNSQNHVSKYKKLKINTSKLYSPQFPPILALKIQCITL